MSLLSTLLSAVKSEIDWVISSLAVAETAADQPAYAPTDKPADAGAASAPDVKGPELASIVDTHADSAPVHHAAGSSVEQNYLHHIKYEVGDNAATHSQSAILASASSDLAALPHTTVAPIDAAPIESFGDSSQSGLFAGIDSHPTPFADDAAASISQLASVNSQGHR